MEILSTHSSRLVRLFVAEERARYDWPSIYLDTSIVSYLTARLSRHLDLARSQRLTRIWWSRYRHRHVHRVSTRVHEEAAAGDSVASSARMKALAGIDVLLFDARAEQLAEKLMGNGRLPERAHSDAAHVAIAATNSLAVLLTWNCKHLANRSIHRKIVRVCEVEGFRCPEICTPDNLMGTYIHAKSNPV